MARRVLDLADVHDFVCASLGQSHQPGSIQRLTGGTRKGVYRMRLSSGKAVLLYRWSADECFWPASHDVSDSRCDLLSAQKFADANAALVAAAVPTPALLAMEYGDATLGPVALVEDAGQRMLEEVLQNEPARAERALHSLREALQRMAADERDRYGSPTELKAAAPPRLQPTEDFVLAKAVEHLTAIAETDARVARARTRISEKLQRLHAAVTPRSSYCLVHGELGPDHVFVTPQDGVLLIDIEDLQYFDIEWEQAWMRMRFGATYAALDLHLGHRERLELYTFAQTLSLIEGPRRVATTDFPDRDWMLRLAELNVGRLLSQL